MACTIVTLKEAATKQFCNEDDTMKKLRILLWGCSRLECYFRCCIWCRKAFRDLQQRGIRTTAAPLRNCQFSYFTKVIDMIWWIKYLFSSKNIWGKYGCSSYKTQMATAHFSQVLCFSSPSLLLLFWQDEKAEGFISLPEFRIDRAIECRRKQ